MKGEESECGTRNKIFGNVFRYNSCRKLVVYIEQSEIRIPAADPSENGAIREGYRS